MTFLTHGRLYAEPDEDEWAFRPNPNGHERPSLLSDLFPELTDGDELFKSRDNDVVVGTEDVISVFADPLPVERVSRLAPKRKVDA